MMRSYKHINSYQLIPEVLPFQQCLPASFLQITGKQNLETSELDKHSTAKVVRVCEIGKFVVEGLFRDATHVIVERLGHRLVVCGMDAQEPLNVTR
ncbi:hypothetical protein D3C71_1846290 [compost metagenome]